MNYTNILKNYVSNNVQDAYDSVKNTLFPVMNYSFAFLNPVMDSIMNEKSIENILISEVEKDPMTKTHMKLNFKEKTVEGNVEEDKFSPALKYFLML